MASLRWLLLSAPTLYGVHPPLLLLIATLLALALTNSPLGSVFAGFWEQDFGIALGDSGFRMSFETTTNCPQQPIGVRITYPFHPRCGEMVPVFRRSAYGGVDAIVIPQPDGSVACIPEWMTHERAAHFKLSAEPGFPPEVLRSLRAEIDALLAFLPSESTREQDGHDAKGRKSRKAAARTVRSGRAERGADAGAERAPGHAGGDAADRDRRSARKGGGRR